MVMKVECGVYLMAHYSCLVPGETERNTAAHPPYMVDGASTSTVIEAHTQYSSQSIACHVLRGMP